MTSRLCHSRPPCKFEVPAYSSSIGHMGSLTGKDQHDVNTSNNTCDSQGSSNLVSSLNDKGFSLQNPTNPSLKDEARFPDKNVEPRANCKQEKAQG